MYMAMESFRSNCACAQYSGGVFSTGLWPGNSNAGCAPESLGTSVHFKHSAGWRGFTPCLALVRNTCLFLMCCEVSHSCFASSPQQCPPSSHFCKKLSALPGGFELLCQDWTVSLKVDDVWFWPAASTMQFFAVFFKLLYHFEPSLPTAYCCSWRSSYAPCKTEQHIEINKD